ncbi:MAG: S26 family signal peptidase [Candidatus Omnitrophota bacterium]|nr:S26 family signal peptidase [Candidatus Omnitrophota bacterium]MDZ4242648.1 S26 family signal peptidase [Candidatus Omnitrophota bacterium]
MTRLKISITAIVVTGILGIWAAMIFIQPFKIIYPDGSVERLWVNKFVYRFQEPQPGDRVIFDMPDDPLLSRRIGYVLGFPGDELRFGLPATKGQFVIVKWREEFLIIPRSSLIGKAAP